MTDYGFEINLISMDLYKKDKGLINMKHEWQIRVVTQATEGLHGACPNVQLKVGDVEIDQHFFVQVTSFHLVTEEKSFRSTPLACALPLKTLGG